VLSKHVSKAKQLPNPYNLYQKPILISTKTELGGTWHGPYANQGICVLQDWAGFWYNLCVDEIPDSAGLLDKDCIPGDGEGLTVTSGASATSTGLPPRVTFTKRAF
jgi:hypothetical protein